MRIGQGVRLPWTGEHGEAAVASAELPLPRFLQESIPAPFVRGVSLLLQHLDLSQRFSQQPAGSLLSSQDPALGCPVHGLAGLLLSRRVCQNVPSLPFRCLSPRVEVSTVCLFLHPTSLHGTFACSFGCKGVVRSVSGWLSCWENCSTWRYIFDVFDPQPALLLTVFRIKPTPYCLIIITLLFSLIFSL